MFGRKKKDEPVGDIPVTPVPDSAPLLGSGQVPDTAHLLRMVAPRLMEGVRDGDRTLRRTIVTTSITENGHAVDPNSEEGKRLMAMLESAGVHLDATVRGATDSPTADSPAADSPAADSSAADAPTAQSPTLPDPTAFTAPPMPTSAPMAQPDLPTVDQAAVAMALGQAQMYPDRMPAIVALVDDYVHGRIDHARFDAERRRIVGY